MSSGFNPTRARAPHRQQADHICNRNDGTCTCRRHPYAMTPTTSTTTTNGMRLLSPLPDFVVGSSRDIFYKPIPQYERTREMQPRRGDSPGVVDYTHQRTSSSAPIPIPRRQPPRTNRANAYELLDGYTSNNTYDTGTVSYTPPSLTSSTPSTSWDSVSSFGMPRTPPSSRFAFPPSSADKSPDNDELAEMEGDDNIFDRRDTGYDEGLDMSVSGRPWGERVQPPAAPRLRTIPLPPVTTVYKPRR
ncbi:hypothetical protein QCA50_013345 [Cerrena zonata]|uniref:Uncharacterized protein n=1 Tax=Cerrena zonata TaxID=2478898 RepID=A0AAW0FRV4_9APHY